MTPEKQDMEDNTKSQQIAAIIESMTYRQLWEMADWFSVCTSVDEYGNDTPRTISTETWMANLIDWCENGDKDE